MISKTLAVTAAVILLSGVGAPIFAQPAGQPAAQPATTTAPTGDNQGNAPATTPDQTAPAGAATNASSPPVSPAPAAAPASGAQLKDNPYGLRQLWEGQNGKPDWVARGVMILLALMSIGTWYIFFMKYWEQQRVLGQSRQVEKRFWSSNNLNDGIDQLAKNSVFRTVAETGVRA
jgi:biopolymer transport protein ExbB